MQEEVPSVPISDNAWIAVYIIVGMALIFIVIRLFNNRRNNKETDQRVEERKQEIKQNETALREETTPKREPNRATIEEAIRVLESGPERGYVAVDLLQEFEREINDLEPTALPLGTRNRKPGSGPTPAPPTPHSSSPTTPHSPERCVLAFTPVRCTCGSSLWYDGKIYSKKKGREHLFRIAPVCGECHKPCTPPELQEELPRPPDGAI